MKLTKENATEYVEKVLADPDKRKKLVESIIESGVIDFEEEKEEELIYRSNYFIDEGLMVSDYYGRVILQTDQKFEFDFISKETAELWAKKLSALNKLRMIKELIDDNQVTMIGAYRITCSKSSGSYLYFVNKINYGINISTFTFIFSSQKTCAKAIELMGKEALDDLFLEIN
jgi:hypothetical protein